MFRFALALSSLSLLSGTMSAARAADCASLQSLKFPHATITGAELIEPGSKVMATMGSAEATPAFCRVQALLEPSTDSRIQVEVWLPQTAWNGRLLNVGNGGFAGSIGYGQMRSNVQHGFATAGSDAGHRAEAEDASWAYHHPEKIADFGWRAVHLTADLSKALVQSFYGKPQSKAYFDACSDGGREALMEAQRFPDDYDGILAGAPANNWTHLLSGSLVLNQALAKDPAAYIPDVKLPAITRAALKACDEQDRLKDGVISNPEACHFDPGVLACTAAEDENCLTPPQIGALRTLYRGAHGAGDKAIFPGLAPGDESPSWHDWVLGNAPAGASGTNYMTGYFRYMVFSDPVWNPLTANADEALRDAVDRTAKDVDATDPDLSRFAAHGGKLIIYHGWNDPAISPWNSVNYAASVRKAMGARADGVVRLYMVPGMEHCGGGPGPNLFGQLGAAPASGPGTGILDALQDWVEAGHAPGTVLAVKETKSAENKVRTVRPLCAYPQRTAYKGKGDPNTPDSFECVAP